MFQPTSIIDVNYVYNEEEDKWQASVIFPNDTSTQYLAVSLPVGAVVTNGMSSSEAFDFVDVIDNVAIFVSQTAMSEISTVLTVYANVDSVGVGYEISVAFE